MTTPITPNPTPLQTIERQHRDYRAGWNVGYTHGMKDKGDNFYTTGSVEYLQGFNDGKEKACALKREKADEEPVKRISCRCRFFVFTPRWPKQCKCEARFQDLLYNPNRLPCHITMDSLGCDYQLKNQQACPYYKPKPEEPVKAAPWTGQEPIIIHGPIIEVNPNECPRSNVAEDGTIISCSGCRQYQLKPLTISLPENNAAFSRTCIQGWSKLAGWTIDEVPGHLCPGLGKWRICGPPVKVEVVTSGLCIDLIDSPVIFHKTIKL